MRAWQLAATHGYHINVFYGEEDGGYVADIPSLEACSASGPRPKRRSGGEASQEALLAAARRAAKPISEPRYRSAMYTR